MSLTTHHITLHSTGFSNSRTCTGAELFQLSIHPLDFMCMFISNGLTISNVHLCDPLKVWNSQGSRFTVSLYSLSGWRWAFVPTQDTCKARHGLPRSRATRSHQLDWLFEFDHVDVDRVASLFGVKQNALWPSMERSAMKQDLVSQKVSLLEWLYSAPLKVCVRTYP